ncbi:MAG: cell wall-active antibiotics response protein [Acidimicrobiia bacterium]|nr:cell wall-active antibiotics response protein [Acidimicrobiia bacterium]MDH3398127.1 cell wall-active antibiotics response protein [Acidimicrobiia bacterium]
MNRGRLLVGFVLIALGLLFLLDQNDVLDSGDLIADWWPAVFVVAGLLYLSFTPRHITVPAVLIIIGLALLARSLDFVPDWLQTVFWPLVLVVIGLWVILGSGLGSTTVQRGDRVNSLVAFFGREVVNESQQFGGGSIFTMFGGTEIDLRRARPVPEGAAMDVVVAFGGVEIVVPEGWRVEVKGIPLFGGWSNKTRRDLALADAPLLSVEALVAFGGLDIGHKPD